MGSGALNFTKKIYDDVRNLDYQIKNKIDDEYKLQTLLGLDDDKKMKKKVVMNGGDEKVMNENSESYENESDNNNDSDSDDDDDDEYEEEESEEENKNNIQQQQQQSYTSNILTGKSRALIVRNSNTTIDIWEIIRRFVFGNYNKKKNITNTNGNVMII